MSVFDILECVWLSGKILSGFSVNVSDSIVMFCLNLCDWPNLQLQFPESAGPCVGKFKLATPVTDQADILLGMPALARHAKRWILEMAGTPQDFRMFGANVL